MSFLKSRWPMQTVAVCALGMIGAILLRSPLVRADAAVVVQPPSVDKSAGAAQTAVLAGGCFWGRAGRF